MKQWFIIKVENFDRSFKEYIEYTELLKKYENILEWVDVC